MTPPAPIETAYAGCRFRSRLEARWAVFFDALGVPWEYEPQGYSLPSGPYLPDFRLQLQSRHYSGKPQKRAVWFEVKPALCGAEWRPNDERWSELAQTTRTDLYCARGMARFVGTELEQPDIDLTFGDGGGDESYLFCICACCRAVGIEFDGRTARLCLCYGTENDKMYNWEDPALLRAYRTALSARFEHGEQGAVP